MTHREARIRSNEAFSNSGLAALVTFALVFASACSVDINPVVIGLWVAAAITGAYAAGAFAWSLILAGKA